MSWLERKAAFQRRFDALAQEGGDNMPGMLTELNTALGSYISKAGLNQDPTQNPSYNRIIELATEIEEYKNRYAALNNDILEYLKQSSNNNNLSELLTKNGTLQQQIKNLQKVEDELKIDVESATARDELLRSRNNDISSHQLFLLDRPVRRGMIPYLWVFSILFIGIGLVIFKMLFPATDMEQNMSYVVTMIYEFFSNQMVLFVLLGVAIITIIFLSLKVVNVI